MSFNQIFTNLTGKILIASPYNKFNEMFSKAVIYVLSHNNDGAAGLIVNSVMTKLPLKALFTAAKLSLDEITCDQDTLIPMHIGGPMEVERGFFIHSTDYVSNGLLQQQGDIAVSASGDVLKDIAHQRGPKNYLFIIGYTGWSANQLENEIENNCWLIAEPTNDVFFNTDNNKKWNLVIEHLKLDDTNFTINIGHC